MRSLAVINNETPDVCEPCGGKCCKSSPGLASPEQWGSDDRETMSERIATALASGLWSIDAWEDGGSTYFLRPATFAGSGKVYDYSWGGACILLGKSGCTLRFDERPLNCQDLVAKPEPTGQCTMPDGRDKKYYVDLWLPFQDVLHDAGRRAEMARTV